MDTSNISGKTCTALVQEGLRKGEICKFLPLDNGYCGRHERNKIYDDGILEGKKWCRFFFRGCNNTVDKGLTCNYCIKKKHEGKQLCKHEGCTHHTKEFDFCKKHERDIYYIEEKEKGFKYCDIARGCFSICDSDKKSCNECLEKFKLQDKERFNKRKEMQNALKQINSIVRICVDCGNKFDNYLTQHNTDSKRCKNCNQSQKNQDSKRIRIRNEKHENFNNKERYYKSYINNALKREYEFTLNFEEFCELVDKECFYCHHNISEETNGIDRIDNSKGYTQENTVSCCEKCNRIKHVYHVNFFVEKCKIIGLSELPNKEFYSKWEQYYTRSCSVNYTNYKKNALEKRDLFFNISQKEWDILTRQPCYLCGYKRVFGIGLDRVDNTIRGYSITNVRPSCATCNDMKNELDLITFIEHCKKIYEVCTNNKILNNVQIIKDNIKDLETTKESRKVWKALGVYYTILANKEEEFYESSKEVFTKEELKTLCLDVKKDTKEKALEYLSKLLNTLKVRRQRLKNK